MRQFKRHCVICGNPLRTGIKYCHKCKSQQTFREKISQNNYPIPLENTWNSLHWIGIFIFGILFLLYYGIEKDANRISYISISLGILFFGLVLIKLIQWIKRIIKSIKGYIIEKY